MMAQALPVLGGIGLFLLGMKIMTDALREAAGAGLRRLLARFTTTPLRGVASGALTTAVIQSSSATTVMTVGFVGAGLLSFPHALGVIYGANIGTTVTGWIVSLVGFKLRLGTVAMGLLFMASLALLLTEGRMARLGRIAAGFSLLFIGLDMMQDSMSGAGGWLHPDRMPSDGIGGLLIMAFVGLAMTVVMQSSSAAVAVVLVLLDSGALTLMHAAAAVIGMNLGTTFTALLAVLGGSRGDAADGGGQPAVQLRHHADRLSAADDFGGCVTGYRDAYRGGYRAGPVSHRVQPAGNGGVPAVYGSVCRIGRAPVARTLGQHPARTG